MINAYRGSLSTNQRGNEVYSLVIWRGKKKCQRKTKTQNSCAEEDRNQDGSCPGSTEVQRQPENQADVVHFYLGYFSYVSGVLSVACDKWDLLDLVWIHEPNQRLQIQLYSGYTG